MNVSVSSLDGKISERKLKINANQARTYTHLKTNLAALLGLVEDQFDIVKLRTADLAQGNENVTNADLENMQIVIHPTIREIPDHLKTEEEDAINGTMETDHRVMMSCGHGITPENLYDYCWNMLLQRNLKFVCPAMKFYNHRRTEVCNAEWTLYEVTLKARLSTDERALFEMKLNYNHWQEQQGIQECPTCHTVCERQSSTNNRVSCMVCLQAKGNQYEFCWQCLGPWKTDNTEYCGNVHCTTAKGPKAIQDILNTCPQKTIDHIQNCPSVRVCPGCKALVEHTQGCKRMTCKCKFQFCFICLKTWDNGCGYNKKCSSVAPRQNIT